MYIFTFVRFRMIVYFVTKHKTTACSNFYTRQFLPEIDKDGIFTGVSRKTTVRFPYAPSITVSDCTANEFSFFSASLLLTPNFAILFSVTKDEFVHKRMTIVPYFLHLGRNSDGEELQDLFFTL